VHLDRLHGFHYFFDGEILEIVLLSSNIYLKQVRGFYFEYF
jgi:hypothetical protein